jgi:hypothetical protein
MSENNRNPFGGKNPHGMYVPLTDTELEALARLAEAGEFKVVVKNWGEIIGFRRGRYVPEIWHANPIPLVVFGDKRISFYFRMSLNAPAVPQPNWYFDMEVWALGHKLFSQRMPTEHAGKPIQVAAGVDLDLALDLALDKIDPAIVKQIMPKAIGLTTRHGNMRLDLHQQRLLAKTQQGERLVREVSASEARAATEKEKKATGR